MKLTELAIFTDAVPETVAFYEQLFGCGPAHRGDGMAIFEIEGVQILIHRKYEAESGELPGENHIAFSVPDLDAAVGALQNRGMEIQFPARDYDWGRSAYLRDPAGNLLELHEQP